MWESLMNAIINRFSEKSIRVTIYFTSTKWTFVMKTNSGDKNEIQPSMVFKIPLNRNFGRNID